MLIASCPLRISLVGGSTDHPYFLQKYKRGSVISFPCDLKVYVSIHEDSFGANKIDKNYVINYSKKEKVKKIKNIKNELIRFCFEKLNPEYINCSLVSDVYSTGSGLATSSAYLLALIKVICVHKNIMINDFEICKLAEEIEKKFNPLVGQQDFYGSLPSFKKINFIFDEDPNINFLSSSIFNHFDMYLIHTGVSRKSSVILNSINVDKCLPLLKDVEDLEYSIKKNDINFFHHIINRSWENKKNTSPLICENKNLINLDLKINSDKNILSRKLCGAGNGGYFLIFCEKNKEDHIYNTYRASKKINISNSGIEVHKI